MPAPYSDNLYSADDGVSDGELEDALSPADGYFHASSTSNVTSPVLPTDTISSPTHSNVPHVPNVLVEDPTLREQHDGEAKAKEAEEERRLNMQSPSHGGARLFSPTNVADRSFSASPSTQSGTQQYPRLSTSHHHYRRSVEDDIPLIPGESRSSTNQPYTPSNAGSSSRTRPAPHQHQSHGDAPPAYSPRTAATPTSPLSPQQGAGYHTFGSPSPAAAMGVPEEQQSLLPREPESMGGPADGQEPSRWQAFRSRFGGGVARRGNSSGGRIRRWIKNVLLTLMLVSIFLLVLSSFTIRPTDRHGGDDGNSKTPPSGGDDGDSVMPPKQGNGHDKFEWDNLNICYNDHIVFPKITLSNVKYDPQKSLTIVQTIEKHNYQAGVAPRVSGDVIFRPTDSYPPGSIDLEVMSNDMDLEVTAVYVRESQKLEIYTPRKFQWSRHDHVPCIQIRVTVWVPQDADLSELTTQVVHLNIAVDQGLVLGVNGTAYLTTTAGDVIFPNKDDNDDKAPYKLESRRIEISTISGDVKGWFPLYDLLQIHTASGTITTKVQPKPILAGSPKSAVLDVRSISGDLHVFEPVSEALASSKPGVQFPPRDYVALLSTASGDVTADLAFSSKAAVSSQSGDFKLRLWPILDASTMLMSTSLAKPELTTHTDSGETAVELLSPMWTTLELLGGGQEHDRRDDPTAPWFPPLDRDVDFPNVGGKDPFVIIDPHGGENDDEDEDDEDWMVLPTLPSPPSPPSPPSGYDRESEDPALSGLISKHSSISGGVKLRYPGVWEGTLKAQTISGSQRFRGKGLNTWRKGGSYVHIIEGEKRTGESGDSKLTVESVSGDEDFLVGEE